MLALSDLSAAFDTIDHAKLIHMLEHEYGVRGTALEWISSYLSGRYFQVKVGDIRSDPRRLVCAVPRDSVLGSVIFSLFTRPLSRIINRCNLQHHKYAHDVQMYDSFIRRQLTALALCQRSRAAWSECEPGCCRICLRSMS